MYNEIIEIHGEDLRPRYYLNNDKIKITEEEIILNPSPENIQRWADQERRKIIKREETLNEKPELFHNLQRVNIDVIQDTPPGWNLFDEPTPLELLDLIRSIESIGLINPIHVTLNMVGVYSVICGRFRLKAYRKLYELTGLEKYRLIPCYVIALEKVDELFLRNFIFESNFRFRRLSKQNMINCLLENYELMKLTKMHRNENNIAMELAKQFDISESSVFNFLRVKKLCDEGRTLLYDERITLRAALYLTRVSKELQKDILETYGVEGVNVIFKLKLLTSKDNITMEELKKTIEVVDNLVPDHGEITIIYKKELANPLMECLVDFKKTQAATYAGNWARGNFSNVFKIRYNKQNMGFHLDSNIVDEALLNKLLAKNISQMAKLK